MQLAVDQVDLSEVGLIRVTRHARAVLYGGALVGIALHTKASDKQDSRFTGLVHGVGRAAADRRHHAFQIAHLLVLAFHQRSKLSAGFHQAWTISHPADNGSKQAPGLR